MFRHALRAKCIRVCFKGIDREVRLVRDSQGVF
jgi:hypothetical protein